MIVKMIVPLFLRDIVRFEKTSETAQETPNPTTTVVELAQCVLTEPSANIDTRWVNTYLHVSLLTIDTRSLALFRRCTWPFGPCAARVFQGGD